MSLQLLVIPLYLHVPAVDKGEEADTGCGQHLDAVVGRVALREEQLDGVLGEGEGHDGDGAGPHDEALRPQTHEPDEGAQRVQDIGVVTAGLGTQL